MILFRVDYGTSSDRIAQWCSCTIKRPIRNRIRRFSHLLWGLRLKRDFRVPHYLMPTSGLLPTLGWARDWPHSQTGYVSILGVARGRAIGSVCPSSTSRRFETLLHSSRNRTRGLTESARCAGIHVASNPSAAIASTTPARTRGSRGVAS